MLNWRHGHKFVPTVYNGYKGGHNLAMRFCLLLALLLFAAAASSTGGLPQKRRAKTARFAAVYDLQSAGAPRFEFVSLYSDGCVCSVGTDYPTHNHQLQRGNTIELGGPTDRHFDTLPLR